MKKLVDIIISETGCSRLKAEAAERKIIAQGWWGPVPHEEEKPKAKKTKEPKTHEVEIIETLGVGVK